MDSGPARRLLPLFGLVPAPETPALPPLPGSPERCVERFACADAEGRAWLLERLAPAQAPRREQIARLLCALCAADPELARLVPAYRPLADGNFVLRIATGPDAGCWQLSPLIAHVPLPRPGYLDQSWRGEAVAGLLLRLQAAGGSLPAPLTPQAPSADLPAYAHELFASIATHRPGLLPRLTPLRAHVDTLPELLAAQPVALVHGDLHPLNILWGAGPQEPVLSAPPIRALIDWEFAGRGPALYDAANCIGCAAFEGPSALSGGFVRGLVRGLALSPGQSHLLAATVPATRLGWLSEWLRKGDAEMLEMELDYLDILLELGPDRLSGIWLNC